MDFGELADELLSQRTGYDAMWGDFIARGLKTCSSGLGGSSTERGKAAGPRPEPAGSSKSGASSAAGHRDGLAAAAEADRSSVEGSPTKAQMSQPSTSRKVIQQMPSQPLDQSTMAHPDADMGGEAATASTIMATAKAQAVQSPPTESAAQDLTSQDRSDMHRGRSSRPDMNDIPGLIAWAKEQLALEDKAAQAKGREAAPEQQSEQSRPELAAQEAKQARKQAKRARQRARRAQGAAAGADSKVCTCL